MNTLPTPRLHGWWNPSCLLGSIICDLLNYTFYLSIALYLFLPPFAVNRFSGSTNQKLFYTGETAKQFFLPVLHPIPPRAPGKNLRPRPRRCGLPGQKVRLETSARPFLPSGSSGWGDFHGALDPAWHVSDANYLINFELKKKILSKLYPLRHDSSFLFNKHFCFAIGIF